LYCDGIRNVAKYPINKQFKRIYKGEKGYQHLFAGWRLIDVFTALIRANENNLLSVPEQSQKSNTSGKSEARLYIK